MGTDAKFNKSVIAITIRKRSSNTQAGVLPTAELFKWKRCEAGFSVRGTAPFGGLCFLLFPSFDQAQTRNPPITSSLTASSWNRSSRYALACPPIPSPDSRKSKPLKKPSKMGGFLPIAPLMRYFRAAATPSRASPERVCGLPSASCGACVYDYAERDRLQSRYIRVCDTAPEPSPREWARAFSARARPDA
jgi:hypothetical protein